jgi:hypothetical protein
VTERPRRGKAVSVGSLVTPADVSDLPCRARGADRVPRERRRDRAAGRVVSGALGAIFLGGGYTDPVSAGLVLRGG